MCMKLCSVIVPVFNISKYLLQCIESIINQTYRDLQIILVDDGSTDSSGKICDEYAKKDSRIIVIHKENGGLVSARKEGLKQACGEYIIYVDGDDWIDGKACEEMLHRITETQADIVFYDHFENTENSQKLVRHNIDEGIYNKSDLVEKIYPHMIASESFYEWQVFPSVWDMVIKRNILEFCQNEVHDGITMGEDAVCVYPCLLKAETVCFERKAFYHYRHTQTSMIKQQPDVKLERERLSLLLCCGNAQFSRLTDIYDVRQQWISYLLFVMVPRANQLFQGYDELPYIYPYKEVTNGMRVAIYGAGTFGQRLCRYLKESGRCEVVAWYDRNYKELRKQGFDVVNPELITECVCDGIILANMFNNSRKKIRHYIEGKTAIKIFDINKEFIFSEESLNGFGLALK